MTIATGTHSSAFLIDGMTHNPTWSVLSMFFSGDRIQEIPIADDAEQGDTHSITLGGDLSIASYVAVKNDTLWRAKMKPNWGDGLTLTPGGIFVLMLPGTEEDLDAMEDPFYGCQFELTSAEGGAGRIIYKILGVL